MEVANSKAEAVRTGARFYRSTTICPKRHSSPRYARGGRCVDCTKQSNADRLGHRFVSGQIRGVVCVARQLAISLGQTTYTGPTCKFGHVERFTASSNCVECNRAALIRDASKRSWSRRERLYGLDEAGFAALSAGQDGRCPICTDVLPDVDRVHIDHCHSSGRVRGLLCGPCNQGIGLLREDQNIMRRAIAYVAG